jgi:hypothetical protein
MAKSKVIGFLSGALLGSLVLWWLMPVSNQAPEINYLEYTDAAIALRLAKASDYEVQRFMDQVAESSIPESFVLPAYISGAENTSRAVQAVNSKYRQFSQTRGVDHIEEVRAAPAVYREYIHTHRAMKKYFAYRDSLSAAGALRVN